MCIRDRPTRAGAWAGRIPGCAQAAHRRPRPQGHRRAAHRDEAGGRQWPALGLQHQVHQRWGRHSRRVAGR
eukprot:5636110-Alexandrium_andersonii.AAC.1